MITLLNDYIFDKLQFWKITILKDYNFERLQFWKTNLWKITLIW